MFEDFIRERITELRMRKNVSERCMSLDMGHSEGYINHITSGKAMPSMIEFFEICRYFGITPYEFFNENMKYPEKIHKIIKDINKSATAHLTRRINAPCRCLPKQQFY